KEEPKVTKKDDKAPAKAAPRVLGTDLVLRNLADGAERVVEEVSEYSITRDGKTLVCIVSSKNEETSGVYAILGLPHGPLTPLISGKGKYWRLIWDEKQAQIVFLSDRNDAKAQKPQSKLYRWDRHAVVQPVAQAKDSSPKDGGPLPPRADE